MNRFLVSCVKKLLHLSPDLIHSQLFDDTTFYKKFVRDLKKCKKEVIIESPFITSYRMSGLISVFRALVAKKVKVYVITRDPNEHAINMKQQAEDVIRQFETMGVQVLISAEYSHRKLAILDRKILWEGSLNILSQTYSREIMRRIDSETHATECFEFIRLGKYIY